MNKEFSAVSPEGAEIGEGDSINFSDLSETAGVAKLF